MNKSPVSQQRVAGDHRSAASTEKELRSLYPDNRIRWVALSGAFLWLVGGLLLSLRSAGTPPLSFRKTADLMPVLAIGLVLIGVATALGLSSFANERGRSIILASRAVGISSLAYGCGLTIRQLFLQATGWEPLMPLGFLGFILSWAFLTVLALRQGIIARLPGYFLAGSAIALFSFNDQFNPYGAIAFGLLAGAGITLLTRRRG